MNVFNFKTAPFIGKISVKSQMVSLEAPVKKSRHFTEEESSSYNALCTCYAGKKCWVAIVKLINSLKTSFISEKIWGVEISIRELSRVKKL